MFSKFRSRRPSHATVVRRRNLACLTIAALATVAVSGCGDDDREESAAGTAAETATTEAEAQPTGKPVDTVDVSETEYKLDPADPTVAEAGVVEFAAKNDGEVVHALEVEGPSGEAETEEIQPGDSATLKVDLSEPGEYTWYCPIANHQDLGMEGAITVEGG